MDVCPEVTRILLEAAPEALYVKDNSGETPLSRLCEWWTLAVPTNWINEEVKINCGLSSDEEQTLKLHPLHAQWEKIILMLRAASKHLSRTKFRPLHIAAHMGCPPTVLRNLHFLNKGQITEIEEETGRRPLSVAAASPHVCGKEGLETLQELLQLDPSAARAPDYENRFPLHLAIDSGKAWEMGIESIALVAPAILLVPDCKTNLLPFMASAEKGSINDTYSVLKNCPEVLEYGDWRGLSTKVLKDLAEGGITEQNCDNNIEDQIPALESEDDIEDYWMSEMAILECRKVVPKPAQTRTAKRRASNFDENTHCAMKRIKNMKSFDGRFPSGEDN
eukprot:CAMPEP_0185728236 /NCGR_PEP_ID=MMETSP1171-20130828/3650_1 /TAXON_ID=374046 /ORGANISM="Helicotheca tamensis, Strain CCMP826" /LENGTH=334 /DNA_ID=CAMNT_0028396919 /DNA_START=229 /DNA_END=1233 /DNA_ORIENTATION=+